MEAAHSFYKTPAKRALNTLSSFLLLKAYNNSSNATDPLIFHILS